MLNRTFGGDKSPSPLVVKMKWSLNGRKIGD